jgi:hypothetical protein
MKTVANRVLLVLVVALCAVAAQAQSRALVMGTVPFDFYVGNQAVPSGEYTIGSIQPNVQAWYNEQGTGKFMFMTNPIEKIGQPQRAKLVFDKLGDAYYLAEIWTADGGHEVVAKPKALKLARLSKPERVEIALVKLPN